MAKEKITEEELITRIRGRDNRVSWVIWVILFLTKGNTAMAVLLWLTFWKRGRGQKHSM